MDSFRRIVSAIAFLVFVTGLLFSVSGLEADDNVNRTSTSVKNPFPIDAAFLNSTIEIESDSAGAYNLSTVSGGFVNRVEDSLKIKANASSEGRYVLWDESNSNTTQIDLFDNSSDVVGRLRSQGSINNIVLRHWKNASKIDTSTNLNFNLSNIENWNGSDKVYRLNTSKDKYWVGLNTSKGPQYEPARSVPSYKYVYENGTRERKEVPGLSSPRINDLWKKNSFNITGTVSNSSGTVSGVKLQVVRFSSRPSRFAYGGKPPKITNTTGQGGKYVFKGLQRGTYGVRVVDSNYSAINYSISDEEVTFSTYIESASINLNVTNHVGEVKGEIDARKSSEVAVYAMGDRNGVPVQMANFNANHSGYSLKVPNGTYTIGAIKTQSSGQPDFKIFSDIKVKKDAEKTLDFEFPEKVKVTGFVNSSSGPVSNARVRFRNSTKNRYDFTTTGKNGKFSAKVANISGYELSIEPPFDSSLKTYRTNFTVNTTTVSRQNNFTMTEGASLIGTVNSGGNKLDSGYVTLGNVSRNVYRSSRINSSGMFKISGLSQGQNYSLEIDSFGRGELKENIEINSKSDKRMFTVSVKKADLTGAVKNSTGHKLDAEVKISSHSGYSDKKSTSNGAFSFKDLNRSQFYEVTVVPDDNKYGSETKYQSLHGNETLNFTLRPTQKISGYIKSGGKSVEDAYVSVSNYTKGSYGFDSTDQDGYYSIEVPEVRHKVRINTYGDSLSSNTSSVSVSEIKSGNLVNFTLSTGSYLSGTVKDSAGSSLSGSISVWNDTADSYAYDRFSGGSYNLTGISNIGHKVWINVDDKKYDSKFTEVSKSAVGGSKNFTFGRNKGTKLGVTVTNNEGTGIANATIVVSGDQKKTDRTGEAVFPRQEKNTNVTVNVEADGYRGKSKELAIPARSQIGGTKEFTNTTVELKTVTELEVNATVEDSNNEPVSDATVLFVSNETGVSESSSAVTGGSGSAVIEGLSKGDYQVTLVLGEDNFYENTTSISAGMAGKSLGLGSYSMSYGVRE